MFRHAVPRSQGACEEHARADVGDSRVTDGSSSSSPGATVAPGGGAARASKPRCPAVRCRTCDGACEDHAPVAVGASDRRGQASAAPAPSAKFRFALPPPRGVPPCLGAPSRRDLPRRRCPFVAGGARSPARRLLALVALGGGSTCLMARLIRVHAQDTQGRILDNPMDNPCALASQPPSALGMAVFLKPMSRFSARSRTPKRAKPGPGPPSLFLCVCGM